MSRLPESSPARERGDACIETEELREAAANRAPRADRACTATTAARATGWRPRGSCPASADCRQQADNPTRNAASNPSAAQDAVDDQPVDLAAHRLLVDAAEVELEPEVLALERLHAARRLLDDRVRQPCPHLLARLEHPRVEPDRRPPAPLVLGGGGLLDELGFRARVDRRRRVVGAGEPAQQQAVRQRGAKIERGGDELQRAELPLGGLDAHRPLEPLAVIRISDVLPAPQGALIPIVRGGCVSGCWIPRAIASAYAA